MNTHSRSHSPNLISLLIPTFSPQAGRRSAGAVAVLQN